jgi:hypothetical protein
MNMMKRHRVALAAIGVIAGVSWFGLREYHCKLRGAALARQVESIKRDAAEELKIGTNKIEVARFFAEHNISFAMLESEAFGSLRTLGCAPLGCGTDRAFIGAHVKLDGAGTVTEAPRVFGMYQDCL